MSHSLGVENCVAKFLQVAILVLGLQMTCLAQEVQQYLSDGEFSAAITAAGDNATALQQIANSQIGIGEHEAALQTVASIDDDQARSRAYSLLQSGDTFFSGGGGMSGTVQNGGGDQGGITANDFNTLIQLIQNTVASDTWENNGGGNGTMSPYPTGVFVDARGVLNRIPRSNRTLASLADFDDELAKRGSVHKTSNLRKVSLTRLERAAEKRTAQGLPPTDAMLYLAGLTQIRYVILDPDSGEIIVAGPAGSWKRNEQGKTVSAVDGKPVLMLDDLVICLRNAWSNSGKFGCAIVPRKKNLAATKQYVATAKGSGKRWENGLREALGQQDIEVFGIPASSHAARILVDADHHMKLLGMGIEPSIPSVAGYLKRVTLDADGNPPPMDVVRWWFALNYDRLISNEAQTLFEFTGPGVKVLAETELIDADGERIHTGEAIGPTKTFARDFTAHFDELADIYPVYNELKNIFDLAIVANMIREFELAKNADWQMPFFVGNDKTSQTGWQVSRFRPAECVDSVMNRRVIKERRNGELTIHTLIGVSGGVSFDAKDFVNKANLKIERDVEFTAQIEKAVAGSTTSDSWWWD
ncbi:DUF1598 domain-containing protein [Mariniblastus fucicola]|uniref:Secreted protein containing DUF1598 n=1 Tax=Mariniblastus fucicola TaxID=980251 RepID=A0A5B9P904_9BACT|nr:DUF1598 domain-containing protein [Mariniblastus fucicola]QEG21370.1 hypothetical protein MFFC18_12260 [Mariniblastus fucicola]